MTRKSVEAAALLRLTAELKRWCKQRGVSQSAVAMKLGVSASHMNQVINGRARPSRELARRIMDVLENHKWWLH